MRASHIGASLLLLLAGLPCIRYAECFVGDGSTDSAAVARDASACEPWWSSVEQCSVQCLQLQQKSQLHDVTYPEELVSVVWAVLLAGIAICLVVSVATNAWQMQQRTAEKAQYTVERMELQACIRGIKAQAADLGSRAVVAVMQSQARAKQVMLLSAELQAKTVGQQIQQQGQVAIIVPPVSQSTHECQTSDDLDDVLAPTSPKLVGEAASPRGEAPRLQGEASMPQLQDLVAGAPDSDAARCISDQYNAGIAAAAAAASSASAVKGSSPIKLPLGEDAAVQDLMQVLAHARGLPLAAALDRANHHLAEQGLSGRLEVQHSKPAAAASSSSGGLFGTPLAAAAGRPAGILDLDGQQQLGSPLAEAAGQQPVGIPRSLLSGDSSSDRRSSGFVTHDQLSLALMEREFERVKEKNSALKSRNSLLESENKVMQQQLQQLSPAVTPLVPSSAYINRTRGSAGTPSPFNHGFGGQPGSGMRFSPPVNAQLSAPRSGSMLDASSAAASSSCFRGMPVPSPQAPGSVGSTRHSPQGQAVATPGTAPGSATSSASRRTVEPVPMQPLDAAGSPAGRPSPVMQQQPQGQPAAKQLVEALEKARIKQAQVCAEAENRRKTAEAKMTPSAGRS